MSVTCLGITMYDMRTTIKAVAGEALGYGRGVFVAQDGLAYHCDNASGAVLHGWALKATAVGVTVTIVTCCRMETDAVETIGARAYAPEVAGGSAPSTTVVAGTLVGFAITVDRVWVQVPQQSIDAPATG